MFTGLIEEKGKVVNFKTSYKQIVLEIDSSVIPKDVKIGESISVDGVCLTISRKKDNLLSFDVMKETINKTTLKNLKKGSFVNLERALKVGDRLGGHFVYGHVDGVRKISNLKVKDDAYIDIDLEDNDKNFIVEKGSIAIDGISLTIGKILPKKLKAYLIPHTIKNTNLINKKIGDYVNIEFDVITKCATKLPPNSNITKDFLKKTGFVS